MNMAIEKLNIEDFFVMELAANKLNEIIDTINDIDERLSQRITDNWRHHKQMIKRIEQLEEQLEKFKE
jgi:hypothetical protein